MNRRIPLETVAKVKDMVRAGKTYREIEAETGVSAPTISKYQREVTREAAVAADIRDVPTGSREDLLARHRNLSFQLEREEDPAKESQLKQELEEVSRQLGALNKTRMAVVASPPRRSEPDPHISLPVDSNDEDEDGEDETDDNTSPVEAPPPKPKPKTATEPKPPPQEPKAPPTRALTSFIEELEGWAQEAAMDADSFDRVISWIKLRKAT